MAEDVFVYFVKLPEGIDECVTPCADGNYTVYIDERLTDEERRQAYGHALKHIRYGHFDADCTLSVQEMEYEAHYG